MKTKHTPTPWAYHKGADTVDGYKTFDIHRNNGRCECAEWIATVTSIQSDSETAQANAQFIALAVNHHEVLVSTLEAMANRIADMMREYDLPEEANGIICGELDAANIVLDRLTKLKG